jgi:hypothetical protein
LGDNEQKDLIQHAAEYAELGKKSAAEIKGEFGSAYRCN